MQDKSSSPPLLFNTIVAIVVVSAVAVGYGFWRGDRTGVVIATLGAGVGAVVIGSSFAVIALIFGAGRR